MLVNQAGFQRVSLQASFHSQRVFASLLFIWLAIAAPILLLFSLFHLFEYQSVHLSSVSSNTTLLSQKTTPLDQLVQEDGTWNISCRSQRVFIEGVGLSNASVGTTVYSLNTVVEDLLFFQVSGYLFDSQIPSSIMVQDDNQSIFLLDKIAESDRAYSFGTSLSNSSQFTVDIEHQGNSLDSLRGLIVYGLEDTSGSNWVSQGSILNKYLHGDEDFLTYTHPISFPPLAEATDIYLSIALIDNNDPDRIIEIQAESGAIMSSTVISQSNSGEHLDIIRLRLPQVAAGSDELNVTVRSPLNNGDSVVLVGINASYQCNDSLAADLQVDLTTMPENVYISENITYQVTVTNLGPNVARDVALTNQFQGDYLLIDKSDLCEDDKLFTCTLPDLSVGSFESITISISPRATQPPSAGFTSSIQYTATVSGSTYDPDLENNEKESTIQASFVHYFWPIILFQEDIAITSSIDQNQVYIGDFVTVELSIINNSSQEYRHPIELTTDLPQQVEAELVEIRNGTHLNDNSVCQILNDKLSCRFQSISTQQPILIYLRLKALEKGSISLAHSISGSKSDVNIENNQATTDFEIFKYRISDGCKHDEPNYPYNVADNFPPLERGVTYCFYSSHPITYKNDADHDYYPIGYLDNGIISITLKTSYLYPDRDDFAAQAFVALYRYEETIRDVKRVDWCCYPHERQITSIFSVPITIPTTYYIGVLGNDVAPHIAYSLTWTLETPPRVNVNLDPSQDNSNGGGFPNLFLFIGTLQNASLITLHRYLEVVQT